MTNAVIDALFRFSKAINLIGFIVIEAVVLYVSKMLQKTTDKLIKKRVIAGAVILTVLVTIIMLYMNAKYVEVPRLVGIQFNTAQAECVKMGLDLKILESDENEHLKSKVDKIEKQYTQENTVVRKGSTIMVDLYKVPPTQPVMVNTIIPLQRGDMLKVVNTEEAVSLREQPNAAIKERISWVTVGSTVKYLSTAKNGFYEVKHGNNVGYIVAAYLVPEKSNVGFTQIDRRFGEHDLDINGVKITRDKIEDVEAKRGQAEKITDTHISIIYDYPGARYTFNKSDGVLERIELAGYHEQGPRDIYIGMHIAEALSSFPMNTYYVRTVDATQNLILYSDAQDELGSAYAMIRNEPKEYGSGVIEFRYKNEWMELQYVDSFITAIYVYVD